jgi:hypothetical protein
MSKVRVSADIQVDVMWGQAKHFAYLVSKDPIKARQVFKWALELVEAQAELAASR